MFAPLFRDRTDAGVQLGRRVAALLARSAPSEHGEVEAEPPLVLGLPRGGVVVAAEVANALHAPLDIFVVRKIGAPWQPELALGAVADVGGPAGGPEVVLNRETIDALGVDEQYLQREIQAEHAEALRRTRAYRGERPAPVIANRTVIVVDDGIATGATLRLALQVIRRQHPRRLILAVPIAPPDVLEELRAEVDDIVCLSSSTTFTSVGGAYQQFEQTSDTEVIALLREHVAH